MFLLLFHPLMPCYSTCYTTIQLAQTHIHTADTSLFAKKFLPASPNRWPSYFFVNSASPSAIFGFLEVKTPMMSMIAGGATAKALITRRNDLDLDLYLCIALKLDFSSCLVASFDDPQCKLSRRSRTSRSNIDQHCRVCRPCGSWSSKTLLRLKSAHCRWPRQHTDSDWQQCETRCTFVSQGPFVVVLTP